MLLQTEELIVALQRAVECRLRAARELHGSIVKAAVSMDDIDCDQAKAPLAVVYLPVRDWDETLAEVNQLLDGFRKERRSDEEKRDFEERSRASRLDDLNQSSRFGRGY